MGFIDLVKARARADKKTIVLPESMDRRTWEAAETILKEDIANLIIIGTPEDIADHSKGLDVSGATVINPQTYEKTQEYIDLFVELRKSKGMTPEKAKEIIMSDYAYYFLKKGNTTLMIGAEDDKVQEVIDVIKQECGQHQKLTVNMPYISGTTMVNYATMPMTVDVGGATIFVINVDRYEKI